MIFRCMLAFTAALLVTPSWAAFLPPTAKSSLAAARADPRTIPSQCQQQQQQKQRLILPILFDSSSLLDHLSQLETGSEDEPVSQEDVKKVLQLLKKLDQSALSTQQLVDAVFHQSDHEALRQAPQQQLVVTNLPNPVKLHTVVKAVTRFLHRPEDVVDHKKLVEQHSNFQYTADRLDQAFSQAVSHNGKALNYGTYPCHGEFPDVSLKEAMKMLDGVPPREYSLSLKKLVRMARRMLRVKVGLSMTSDDVERAKTAEEKYHAIFTKPKLCGLIPNPFDLVPLPAHAFNSWDDDKEFARQFLNGVNPLMIRVVRNVETDLSSQVIDFFSQDETVDLKALAAKKRLLFVRYDDLGDLPVNPHQAYPLPYNTDMPQTHPHYFARGPLAVFQLNRDLSELEVLAIQLEQGGPVYSATTTDPNVWLFAKATIKSADAQMHEWVSHLGRTHLTMEPHIIAIHNTLKAKNHRLFTFLRPMMRDTLFFNYMARNSLAEFKEKSWGDRNSSVGVGQFMQLIKKYWQRYNFFESSGFAEELASRGFDADMNIPCYLYRQDGSKLWKAYGDFATDFVHELYETDEAVAKDAVLQLWAKETTDPSKAAIPGFPTSFTDRKTVAKVLQTLFWIASGLHAAVNFPQYDYYAYLANHPLAIRVGMEEFQKGNDHSREFMFAHAFPAMDNLKEVISTARLLTLPSNFCIDNLADNFETIGQTSYEKFLAQLKVIGDDIQARSVENKRKGEPIYHYLHPSMVPASIDI